MEGQLAVENNGWTWSHDHEDWYRTELLPDGSWNYIFSKDLTATEEKSADVPSEAGDEQQSSSPSIYTRHWVPPTPQEVETADGPHGLIRGTAGNVGKLDPSFQMVKDHWTFFVPGRVFSTLWWESSGIQVEGPSVIHFGGQAFAKLRRFIVVRPQPRDYYSKCIQISTYGGRATTKKGLNQSEHTIVYTGEQAPARIRGETKLLLHPVNVIPVNQEMRLDPLSRVNLGETYPVEHNVKVKEIGRVNPAHLKRLIGYWKRITDWEPDAIVPTESQKSDRADNPTGNSEQKSYLGSPCQGTEDAAKAQFKISRQDKVIGAIQAGENKTVLDEAIDNVHDAMRSKNLKIDEKNALQIVAEEGCKGLRSPLEHDITTKDRYSIPADTLDIRTDESNDFMQVSDAESICSVDSKASSLSSRSSLYSHEESETASEELTALLVNDKTLSRTFKAAFEDEKSSSERFERNLRRLLKQFAVELERETQESLERAAARFAGKHAKDIAHRITQLKEVESGILRNQYADERWTQRPRKVNMDESQSSDGSDLEDHDQANFVSFQNIHTFIISSKALCFLRHRVLRFVQPNMLQAISEEVKLGTQSNTLQEVVFRINWELRQYCLEELEKDIDFALLLTISGTVKGAYATTCGEYMERNWPKSGLETLRILQAAISEETYEMQWSSGFTFSYEQKKEGCTIKVSGSQDHIIEIAQQLSWLGASFRIHRPEKLTLSDAVLQWQSGKSFQLLLLDLQQVGTSKSSCWNPLFENGVIAHGFPIPPRKGEVGIELPFGVMATLAHVEYPIELYQGIILKGPSTALIPTKCFSAIPTSVQWHFISTNTQDLQLTMDSVAEQVSTWYETTDFDMLSKARTFLGYCKNAAVCLGTKDSGYKNIKRSNALNERTRPEISRELSVSFGSSGKGIIGAMFGLKVVYPKALQGTTKSLNLSLENRLLRSRKQPLLLYDTETKRGWLVPELSVVLHIAHVWNACHRASREPRNDMPFANVLADGGLAAWDAIWGGRTLQLSNHDIEGKPELFIDIIKNILAALESRKDMTIERKNASGDRLRSRPGLCGWEFVDIVTWKFMFDRKEVPVDAKTGGDWYRIASENPDIVVLFCNGLGAPIKAGEDEKSCGSWTPTPEGNDYLTATVSCLKQLAEAHGDSSSSLKLTPSLHWHRPSGTKIFEDCDYDGESGCNRLQDLKRKDFNAPDTLEAYGAVIFGKIKPASMNQCEPLKRLTRDEDHETTMEERAIFRPPKRKVLGRDSICNDNITSSMSNRLYNGPKIHKEHAAQSPVPQVKVVSLSPLPCEYPRREYVENTPISQEPQHDSKHFEAEIVGCGSHETFLFETNTVRRRPGFGDLRRDPQSA